jgi:4-diphosphocytidyl-2-C-methyl-D-erythritol kinase
MLQTIRICAPAKVNLILRVLDRRPDGYHNLWSLLHTVGLNDELLIQVRDVPGAISIQCDDPRLPTDGRNLVVRAAAMVLDRARLRTGLNIRLVKRIPVAAGLGGGSTDAAATIAGLNRLLKLNWSIEEMAQAGRLLGSDVPFFFFAPSAQVAGRGDQVYRVTVPGARWIVLLNPGFPVETRWAYGQLATARFLDRPLSASHAKLAAKLHLSWDEIIPAMVNDFEEALAAVHPVLKEMRQTLMAEGAEAALLSGSGATVFGIFPDKPSAMQARDSIERNQGGWWVSAVPAGGILDCREHARGALRVG